MPSKHEEHKYKPEDVFEVAGRARLLKGTSGPAAEPPRTAEGKPVRHDLVVGGRTIPAAGTSGASPMPFRMAAGRPVQHPQNRPGQLFAAGTSGPSPMQLRMATGRPAQHPQSRPGQPFAGTATPTGSGQAVGQPVRRA